LLNLYGIPKPVYRAFELLHRLGSEMLDADGKHETVSARVVRKGVALQVLLTNHVMPRYEIETEAVKIKLTHVAARPRAAFIERIDDEHANPHKLWRGMGAPEYLNAAEVDELETASYLTKAPHPFKYERRTIELQTSLPPHSVALITVELSPDTSAGGERA
jgi:xylan 1,4-beta-xylosidase